MKRIELKSPCPRDSEIPYKEFEYKIIHRVYQPIPQREITYTFHNVLDRRQSRRRFAALDERRLSELLWHSARVKARTVKPQPRWQHRAAPSSGGKHPLDIIIFRSQDNFSQPSIYDPISHALCYLKIENESDTRKLISSINGVIPIEQATVIWYGAQFDHTQAKYRNGESLVWRDAGALLTIFSLVAEALDLACCAVGITGEPWLSQMLCSKGKVVGAGGILIGERVPAVISPK